MKTYFTSDLHFGHKQIISLCKRPFKTIEDMDKTLAENWNNTVDAYDKVFVLGDVSFYSKEKTRTLITRLNGQKVLVKGNHDEQSDQWYLDCGFEKVYDMPVLFHDFFLLSHKPLEWLDKESVFGNLHGHIHDDHRYLHFTPRSYNVSVEMNKYAPVLFETIIAKMQEID